MPANALMPADIPPGVFADTTPTSDVAVSVRGLSKSYSIAKNAVQHSTLGEALMSKLRHPFAKAERDTFWALNDVSFDIQKGDVVGIIGRNGAGKSTLLKILSRITEPTQGKIDLYGRVGSLLEVGTGFHAELTGRENIYLNGAILGMKKSEITRQFDAIVDFSGTEQFLDTPVKRYSSGMYVRLAFAVAAHLNPEILIVDEVLAVGDAEFQKKCLGKMQDVAQSGRTVLFVSHHMQSVSVLCNKGMFLANGKMVYSGGVSGAIDRYIEPNSQSPSQSSDPSRRPGSGGYRIACVKPAKDYFSVAEPKSFMFDVEYKGNDLESVYFSAHIMDSRGSVLAHFDSRVIGFYFDKSREIHGEFIFKTPWLKPGSYYLDATLYHASTGYVDHFERACSFDVGPMFPYPEPATSEACTQGLVMGEFSVQTK